jgi:hypothetical protein
MYRRHGTFTDATLMVQREVADRPAARPGTKAYGVLSVSVQLHTASAACSTCRPGRSGRRQGPVVRRALEFGAPSARILDELLFDRMIRALFSARRKICPTRSGSSTPAGRQSWPCRDWTAGADQRRCKSQNWHGLPSSSFRLIGRLCYSFAKFPPARRPVDGPFLGLPSDPGGRTRWPDEQRACAVAVLIARAIRLERMHVFEQEQRHTPMTAVAVDCIPLGGLGEFGMNMLLVACGETAVLIDAGVMFPEPELFGVDLVIPDLAALERYRGRIQALVLTHGHEDHVGALPYLLREVRVKEIWATKLTLGLINSKLDEHGLQRASELREADPERGGQSLRLEFLRVTHSIPDCVAVAIHTPVGTIIHTGDFKIDQTPLDGELFDLHHVAHHVGASGVLALFSDSTNVDRRGFTGSEREVIEAFEEVFSSARGKIVVTTFASSIYRHQLLVDMAEQFDRKVAFVGRGMQQNSQIAERLGYLKIRPGLQIRDSDVRDFRRRMCSVCARDRRASPWRPPRIAIDDHKHVKLEPDDVVVFSAGPFPATKRPSAG